MWCILRKLLFLFPAEFTHELAKTFLKVSYRISLFKRTFPFRYGTHAWLGALNPVGLAAGFDKNAEILVTLPHFGFGFAEIGTVTPIPQGGNDRPRLFRIPKDRNVFNRMGFNNLGAGIISERVRKAKPMLPAGFRVGVNLGKNKSTSDQDAASDYAKVARAFVDCADYFVINVSSPNTPGLRALQTPEFLVPIVREVQKVVSGATKIIPILVKLAPELHGEELRGLVLALEGAKIDGLILTNTLGGVYIYREKEMTGGYSGQVLTDLSLQKLKEVRAITSLPIHSVGGIMNAEDAKRRFEAGATCIQLYSGWIFGGPYLIRKIVKSLSILR